MKTHQITIALLLTIGACYPGKPEGEADDLAGDTETGDTEANSSETGGTAPADTETGEPCTSDSTDGGESETGEPVAWCCSCSVPPLCEGWIEGAAACEAQGAGLGIPTAWCEADVFGGASGCWSQCEPG
jgi:hypothetical protein